MEESVPGTPHTYTTDVLLVDLQDEERASLSGTSLGQEAHPAPSSCIEPQVVEVIPPPRHPDLPRAETSTAPVDLTPAKPSCPSVSHIPDPNPSASGPASKHPPTTTPGESTTPARGPTSKQLPVNQKTGPQSTKGNPENTTGNQNRSSRKKRIWCFDCRRHGHRPADCPNPTGEKYCGKCPYRVTANRPCPTHKTEWAAAVTSRCARETPTRDETSPRSAAIPLRANHGALRSSTTLRNLNSGRENPSNSSPGIDRPPTRPRRTSGGRGYYMNQPPSPPYWVTSSGFPPHDTQFGDYPGYQNSWDHYSPGGDQYPPDPDRETHDLSRRTAATPPLPSTSSAMRPGTVTLEAETVAAIAELLTGRRSSVGYSPSHQPGPSRAWGSRYPPHH
ncbi:uncharacterized protein LOC135159912 [Diachasmimorpha longicaudata]|uniref:uncharacterized protein LOC135159912 n=1 Tax=Diachasmimorpha longicaudata TaxID=58733 RepID=UPI0030B879D8